MMKNSFQRVLRQCEERRVRRLRDYELRFCETTEKFPLRLAYAMHVNRAAGLMLGRVGLYLGDPVCVPSLMYVAVSRARGSQTAKEIGPPITVGRGQEKVHTRWCLY